MFFRSTLCFIALRSFAPSWQKTKIFWGREGTDETESPVRKVGYVESFYCLNFFHGTLASPCLPAWGPGKGGSSRGVLSRADISDCSQGSWWTPASGFSRSESCRCPGIETCPGPGTWDPTFLLRATAG